jgi:hypothetical protein
LHIDHLAALSALGVRMQTCLEKLFWKIRGLSRGPLRPSITATDPVPGDVHKCQSCHFA